MNGIRPMGILDINEVVRIHRKSFSGFFLTFLGPRFLSELYTSILYDPAGLAYVYLYEESVTGFVAGTLEPSSFYRRLLQRRWWRFTLSAFIPALKNPLVIPRLVRAIRKPQDGSHQPNTGLLMSVAVSPEAQHRGIGHMLVKAFLEESANRGVKHIDLTTDRNNNDYVNQFYKRMGFKCSRTFTTPEKREMNEYIIDLPLK